MKHKLLNVILACFIGGTAFGAGYTLIKITGALYTDDTVLVGDGSNLAVKAVADCDDTGGNHLNYDTGTNAFSCGTTGSTSFPLLAPNGSAAAPSYSFSGSSTSGLFYDAVGGFTVLRSATDINFISNGGRLRIGGTGNIFRMASTSVTNDGANCTGGPNNGFSGSNARTGTGACSLLFDGGAFSTAPVCTASQLSATPTAIVSVSNVTASGLDVTTADSTTAVTVDADFSVTCIG